MIRVGVIGTGYIGPVHIEALKRTTGVEVAGVTDANRALAEKTAARYGLAKVYGDHREMLADKAIDAVHVCSPNKLHFAMNLEAIERGKHILSEKPLAMSVAEARELTEKAEKKGVVTGVDFCYRYYPAVQEMAVRVRRGDAGAVRLATGTWFQDWLAAPTDWSWRLDPAESGESNISADLGSHWFDLVQFVTGLEVREVMADFATIVPVRRKPKRQVLAFEAGGGEAQTEEVKVQLEEYSAILFRLSNGAPGSFTTSQTCVGRKSDTEFQIYGSELSYAWNHKRSNEMWIGRREQANELWIENARLMDPAVAGYASLPAGHPLGYYDAVLNLFQDFYAAVRAGKGDIQEDGVGDAARRPPRPTFRTGWHEMRILQAVVKSNRERRWAKVEG